MNTLLKLATVLALVVAGQAMAQSEMIFTLELGGDNHADLYKGFLYPEYTRNPGGDLDGQTFDEGAIIDWAALVEVGGIHQTDPVGGIGDGLPPAGAANIVLSLRLTDGLGNVLLGAGSLTEQGWFSTINDGEDRAGIEIDPLENAAFPTVFNLYGNGANGGRLFDSDANGGPHLDFYSYPSVAGRAGGTDPEDPNPPMPAITDGSLRGMGAGYSYFFPAEQGGFHTGGVGLAQDVADVCTALGVLPLFEGQINTDGLAPGTYTLEVIAEQGNNILWGETDACFFGYWDTFAVPVNNVVVDTITFEIGTPVDPCTDPVVTAAVSRKQHGAAGIFDVDVLNGAIESRVNGVTQLVVTFDQDVIEVSQPSVSVTSGSVTNVTIDGNVVTVDISGGPLYTPQTISFPGLADVTGMCLATGTVNAAARLGDVNGDGNITVTDMVQVRNNLGQPVTASNFRADVNIDGNITVTDMVQVRNNLGN